MGEAIEETLNVKMLIVAFLCSIRCIFGLHSHSAVDYFSKFLHHSRMYETQKTYLYSEKQTQKLTIGAYEDVFPIYIYIENFDFLLPCQFF